MEKVKLGEVCSVKGGYAFKSENFVEIGIPVIRIGDLTDKKVDIKKAICISDNINSYSDYIINKGDILLALSGATTGKFGIYTEEYQALLNQRLARLVPKRGILSSYLYHYMNILRSLILERAKGAAQPNISTKEIEEMEIFVPGLSLQNKIVQILDTAQSLVDQRKKQLEACDELIRSLFYEMFGDPSINDKKWESVTLGDICSIGSSKRIFESEYVSEGIPFYRTKEIVELSKGNPISTELFISKDRFNEIKNNFDVPEKDDILITAVGTIGTIWVVDGKEQFYFKDGNLLWIKSTKAFSSIYLKFLLENLIDYYKKDLSAGSAYSALTIAKMKTMKAYNPPLDLQNRFAAKVQQIERQKTLFQQSLIELEANFNSLMQRAFKGELFSEG